MTERDDGANERPRLGIGLILGDVRAIEFDLVEAKATQVLEGRVPGAEIVEGDRDSEALQLL